MKLTFENFAKAGNGSIYVNDLTVICGPNNTGKTYINYAIYSIYDRLVSHFQFGLSDEMIQKLIDQLESVAEIDIPDPKANMQSWIEQTNRYMEWRFYGFFNLPADSFDNLKISLEFDELNFQPEDSKIYPNLGNIFSCKYVANENEHKLVVAINELSESSPFFEWNDEEKISYIRSIVDVTLYLNFFKNIRKPFPITSERSGISLFQKLFDKKSVDLLESIEKGSGSVENRSKHALPISKNMDQIRDFESISKKMSMFTSDPDKHEGILRILSDLLDGGKFSSINGTIYYESKIDTEPKIPLYAASSSVKSLFLMDLFIKHEASQDKILIIDEPELNLFPANQALIARLIAKLVNSGIKVLATTHSDFFLRELNNLITLSEVKKSNSHKVKIMEDHNYEHDEILKRDQVSAYLTTTDKRVEEMNIDEYGVGIEAMNSIIKDENVKARQVSNLIREDKSNG